MLKNKRFIAVLSTLVLLTVAVFASSGGRQLETLDFGNRQLNIERAQTERERLRGLGGRTSLPRDQGLLFVFEQDDRHCFWMKDMNFPIDIIWVDSAGKVVHIEHSVPPASYPDNFCPAKKARYVLEINAGLARESDVAIRSRLNVR